MPVTVCTHAAAVHFGELFYQRKSYAESTQRTSARAVVLHEQIEYGRELLLGNSDPGIANRDDGAGSERAQVQPYLPAGLGVLGGVGDQVHHDLFEARRIAQDRQRGIATRDRELVTTRLRQ